MATTAASPVTDNSVATNSVATNTAVARRIAGLSALTFGIVVIASNAAMAGAPMADEEVGTAAAWYADNRTVGAIASGAVAFTFPALIAFAGAMFALARDAAAQRWMVSGAAGAAAMVGTFTIVAGTTIATVLLAEAGASEAFAAVWTLHNAAFAVNMSVLGATFFAFAFGAHAAGLTPNWQRVMGVAGALALLITGIGNLAVADGSMIVLVGFVGFLLWLAWLLILGVRLVRS